MVIYERINLFNKLFEDLTDTNSRNEKELIVNEFKNDYPELIEDLTIILETLDNKHPIGWTYRSRGHAPTTNFDSIWEVIQLCKCITNLSFAETSFIENTIGIIIGDFIEPIVNRTLRLGIGKSLLSKDKLSPMLAKKYEGTLLLDDVFVTEKLDGNRCIAYFDGEWHFQSRNGKPMNVSFDMSGLPTEFIYDGEILSPEQTMMSVARCAAKTSGDLHSYIGNEQILFNKTSGLINSKGTKKNLIYNIFDIITNSEYEKRRQILTEIDCEKKSDMVRILPVLYRGRDTNIINLLLDNIISMGGEGIMLNLAHREYENKRTNALLKYKKVQYCDMIVVDIFEGKGKYAGACGGLICSLLTEDGKEVKCEVGTGLSDYQRIAWAENPELIIGKLVEVGYHEMTQDRFNRGTNRYSLRFPRLIRVRNDKKITSEY